MAGATASGEARVAAANGGGAVERREVVVIGAGLSGMYALYRLRTLGFDVHV